jgi:hypothetical protein
MLPVGLDPDCEADGIRPHGRNSEDFMPGIQAWQTIQLLGNHCSNRSYGF